MHQNGERLPLDDDTQDHLCVREAGDFWKERGMRRKVNDAIADVRAEASAGRLRWTKQDVKRLIGKYPPYEKVDEAIQRAKEFEWIERDEPKWAVAEDDSDDCDEDGDDDEGEDDGDGASGVGGDGDGAEGEEGAAVADEGVDAPGRGNDEESAVAGTASAPPLLPESLAEEMDKSRTLLHAYEHAKEVLLEVGAMADVVAIENNMRKEHKRMRDIGNESPAILSAMAATRALEQDEDRKRRRLVWEANQHAAEARKLKGEVEQAKAALKKKQEQILKFEGELEAKHARQNFTLASLGHEQKNVVVHRAKSGVSTCWIAWPLLETASPRYRKTIGRGGRTPGMNT